MSARDSGGVPSLGHYYDNGDYKNYYFASYSGMTMGGSADALFDFTFVQPIKLQERRDKLNEKLRELGKGEMLEKLISPGPKYFLIWVTVEGTLFWCIPKI